MPTPGEKTALLNVCGNVFKNLLSDFILIILKYLVFLKLLLVVPILQIEELSKWQS